MKTINAKQELVDFNGKPLKSGEETFTVGTVMSSILGGQVSNPTLGWVLGKKFATEDTVDLKAEDIVFLKKEIEDNKGFFAIIKGQLIELLDSPVEAKTVPDSVVTTKKDK